ncbi:MAG: TCR/Tet family MFS transporter [Bacteroidetes bacterium]|nr:TCR/Tet family MFS transporter [Bacteroidota bacterium]
MQRRSLTLIFITLLIDSIGIGIIIPILPKLIGQVGHMGISEAAQWGGFLIFAYAAAQFVFAPIMGGLSDQFGRRPVLIISLIGLGVDYVFHAVAPTIELLFIGRIFAGICGASFTTASAYIADISTDENRSQNFGLIFMAFGIGFILGPIIGGVAGMFGARIPFWIAAGFSLVNAALCFFLLPESLDHEHRRKFQLKRANPVGSLMQMSKFSTVLSLMIPMFLLYLASHAVQSNWSFYTTYKFKWSEAMIGISLAVVGVMIAVVQGLLIRLIVPKLGEVRSIIVGFFLYFVGMLLFALATNTAMMMSFIAVYTLGGISGPALQGIMAAQVPQNQQGELNGGTTSLIAITSILGPLIMNSLFAFFTSSKTTVILPGAPMLLGAFLILLATIACIRPLKRMAHKSVEIPEM